ncbi:MAG: DUF6178 family protein [Bacteriovoracaceae bacterium]
MAKLLWVWYLNDMSNKDLLTLLILESKAYSQVEDLEKLVEKSQDLSALPIQPLYLSLKNLSSDQLANILPKLSQEQRRAMIDLDVWNKDELDIKRYSEWPLVYSKCPDESVVSEFVQGEDFALYLKARFSLHTFDVEEPEYPDHDNYFLTDDNLLLVEFDSDFEYVHEVRMLIRRLYDELGVEKAYAHLFKIISDSYSILEEECYIEKKERLRDFGFVDYHEALYLRAHFINKKAMDEYLKNKKATTGEIDDLSKNQTLHSSSLVAYQQGLKGFLDELEKVSDNKRRDFLQFNFVRLVNSTLSVSQALKEGSVAINRVGNQTRQYFELGFSYVEKIYGQDSDLKTKLGSMSLFDLFDFNDFYKVGHTLIALELASTKKILSLSPFHSDEFEYFLGQTLNDVLDLSFAEIVKIKVDGKSSILSTMEEYSLWQTRMQFSRDIIPFAQKFFSSFSLLKEKNLINDNFYLNYEVDNIDLESILISSFINFALGTYSKGEMNKMGLTVIELKKFVQENFAKDHSDYSVPEFDLNSVLVKKIHSFNESYGLSQITGMDIYLHGVLDEQLSGYAYDELKNEEFKHVGGPILLNVTVN